MSKKHLSLQEFADKLKGISNSPKPVWAVVKAPKTIKSSIKNYHDRAGLVDTELLHKERSLKDILEEMPDISTKKLVEVAPKTWIAVDPTRNAVKAKENFSSRYNH